MRKPVQMFHMQPPAIVAAALNEAVLFFNTFQMLYGLSTSIPAKKDSVINTRHHVEQPCFTIYYL